MEDTSLDHSAATGWFGRLSGVPLFTVLRRIQSRRLTGTLTVSREDQSRRFFFENGELRTASSSREDHRIGASLVRWGYISEEDLQNALKLQKEGGARLDQILVEKGLVSRATLDSEAKGLMEQIVFSTLSWRDGDFHFLKKAGLVDPDVTISLSVTEMIIEGIRRIPESEQFLASLGNLSNIPTCTENPASHSDCFRLPPEAAYLLSRIDGKTDAQTLLKMAPGSKMAGAKILFALAYCGLVEMKPPQKETPQGTAQGLEPRAIPGRSPETPSGERTPGEGYRDFVRNTYRRIDWLSHYDLLGIPTKATREEIEEAYSERSRLFDPSLQKRPDLADCGRELSVLSERLRAARDTLVNPTSREAYDRKIPEAQAFILKDPTGFGNPTPNSAKLRRWTASQNYEKARELMEANDFFPAIQLLSESVHFVPDSAEYRYRLGLALLKNRLRRQNAIEHLEEAAKLNPSRADIQATLAKVYLEEGTLENALSCAQKALNLASEKEPYRELEKQVEGALQAAAAEQKRNLFGRIFSKNR